MLIDTKNKIRLAITKTMSPLTKQLFELLFLGYKEESKITEIDLQFKQWGISHFLARSGLHLNFLIALANFFLMYIPFEWCLKQLIVTIIILLYCTFTWTTIPIMRTFATFLLIKLFLCTKHRYDSFNIICLVWMFFLLLNPFYLFFLDFQLTFILSGALTWLSKQPRLA
jgi:competence protein ComEC